jgi:hypothetical protein
MHALITRFAKFDIKTPFYLHLPLLAAVMLEANLHFISMRGNDTLVYLALNAQLLLESLVFFIMHHLTAKYTGRTSMLCWLAGFVCYPGLLFSLASLSIEFSNWSLFSLQLWLLASLASLAWFINLRLNKPHHLKAKTLLSKLLSLNAVIMLLLLVWAVTMAGIFCSHDAPMYKQPLESVIDLARLFSDLTAFSYYLWQFLFLAGLMGSIYAINRYGLIRQVLAKRGLLAYAMATLLSLIVITPLFANLILLLPLNIPDVSLLPSKNYNVFTPYNYQFMFWILFISTPLILAFERQQQDTEFARLAQQKTRTELKLLQQQINPHFLFNTLNNLYALTLTQSQDAPKMVMQLANLLRYTVYEGQKDGVTLAQEVSYLQDYIALQKIRTQDKLTLDVNWPSQADRYLIPPLLLIIVLENAFKHGVEPSASQSHIYFHLTLDGNTLSLLCENSLQSTKKEATGMGLENLCRRLSLLFPDKHSIKSGPNANIWRVELTMELAKC